MYTHQSKPVDSLSPSHLSLFPFCLLHSLLSLPPSPSLPSSLPLSLPPFLPPSLSLSPSLSIIHKLTLSVTPTPPSFIISFVAFEYLNSANSTPKITRQHEQTQTRNHILPPLAPLSFSLSLPLSPSSLDPKTIDKLTNIPKRGLCTNALMCQGTQMNAYNGIITQVDNPETIYRERHGLRTTIPLIFYYPYMILKIQYNHFSLSSLLY